MKNRSLGLCLLALAAVTATAAHADTFRFSFTGLSFSGSGFFTASEIGTSPDYNVSAVYGGSVTGLGNGPSAITGIVGLNGFQGNDNILIYPGAFGFLQPSYFDNNGVSFALANGRDVNLFVDGIFENAIGGRPGREDTVEFDLINVTRANSAVPEPGSLALLGTGVLGLAGMIRRRLAV